MRIVWSHSVMSKVKVPLVSESVSEWQGHLLSCSGQLKRNPGKNREKKTLRLPIKRNPGKIREKKTLRYPIKRNSGQIKEKKTLRHPIKRNPGKIREEKTLRHLIKIGN